MTWELLILVPTGLLILWMFFGMLIETWERESRVGKGHTGRWWQRKQEIEREVNKLRSNKPTRRKDLEKEIQRVAKTLGESPALIAQKVGLEEDLSSMVPTTEVDNQRWNGEWLIPRRHTMNVNFDIDPDKIKEAFKQASMSVSEAQESFRRFHTTLGDYYLRHADDGRPPPNTPPEHRKKITEIVAHRSAEPIDVTRIDSPYTQTIPGRTTLVIRDQDGLAVPRDLDVAVRRMIARGDDAKVVSEETHRIIDSWNNGEEMNPDLLPDKTQAHGHRPGCVYSEYWACSCQPPTIFGPTRLYRCDCCELPRAEMQYGVCDECQAHEYADPKVVEIDHEVMAEDA